jgi:serine/threonine protein kinase/Tol biopolymer transport system component
MIGRTILHYRIFEKLGEGGMGIVYKAHDSRLDRVVALKFLPHSVAEDESERNRFLQEARAAASLNHPNICSIFAIHDEEGRQFIEMEYVDGETLREGLESGGLKTDVSIAYAIEIAEALQEAHSKGIVHRDIKAENIMVNARRQVKVMDFGLAKLKGALKSTHSSSTAGTLAYMAPEQIQGEDTDHRTDLFSFGIVFFEMLTGRLPFRGEHEAAMMYSIVNEEPEPLAALLPDASPELIHILDTLLEKEPENRYQSAAEVLRDLRRIRRRTSKTVRGGPVRRDTLPPRHATSTPAAEEGGSSFGRNNRKMVFLGVLGGLAVIALAGVLLLNRVARPVPFRSLSMSAATSGGNAGAARVSPDGKYILYVKRDSGMVSLWMRQSTVMSGVRVHPPFSGSLWGLRFSPDGTLLYYVKWEAGAGPPSLYRMPVLGGSPVRVLESVDQIALISPDHSRLAFDRYDNKTGQVGIYTASVDGTDERLLSVCGEPDLWYSGLFTWSPDGTTIAVVRGVSRGRIHYTLRAINVSDGRDTLIGTSRWSDVESMEWLSDGRGLVIAASEETSQRARTQLWHVSYPDGVVHRITNDLNNYGSVSLTTDDRTLCVIQSSTETELTVAPVSTPFQPRELLPRRSHHIESVTAAPDGRIYFTMAAAGPHDIWAVNQDGSGLAQLTFDSTWQGSVSASPDGRYLVFESDRGGPSCIWRIRPDGTNAKQLTFGAEDHSPSVTPDGRWVVFQSWVRGPSTIFKVGINGGDRQIVTSMPGILPTVSPDGRRVAFVKPDSGLRGSIYTVPIDGGQPVLGFELSEFGGTMIIWRPRTNEISYPLWRNAAGNIWTRSLDGGPAKQVTFFTERSIRAFCWTADGRSLVVVRSDQKGDVVLLTDTGTGG